MLQLEGVAAESIFLQGERIGGTYELLLMLWRWGGYNGKRHARGPTHDNGRRRIDASPRSLGHTPDFVLAPFGNPPRSRSCGSYRYIDSGGKRSVEKHGDYRTD